MTPERFGQNRGSTMSGTRINPLLPFYRAPDGHDSTVETEMQRTFKDAKNRTAEGMGEVDTRDLVFQEG